MKIKNTMIIIFFCLLLSSCSNSNNDQFTYSIKSVNENLSACTEQTEVFTLDSYDSYIGIFPNDVIIEEYFEVGYFIYIDNISTSSYGHFNVANVLEYDGGLFVLFSQRGIAMSTACSNILLRVESIYKIYQPSDISVLQSNTNRIFVNDENEIILYFLPDYEMFVITNIGGVESIYLTTYFRNSEDNIEIHNILSGDDTVSLIIDDNSIQYESINYLEERD